MTQEDARVPVADVAPVKREVGPLAPERQAFDRYVLEQTGRGMVYHLRNATTGLEFAWSCWQAAVAAERERWLSVVTHAVAELEALDDATAQAQADSLRELLLPDEKLKGGPLGAATAQT